MMNSTTTSFTSLFFASDVKKEVLTWATETLVILMFLMLSFLTGRKLPKTLTRFRQRLRPNPPERPIPEGSSV